MNEIDQPRFDVPRNEPTEQDKTSDLTMASNRVKIENSRTPGVETGKDAKGLADAVSFSQFACFHSGQNPDTTPRASQSARGLSFAHQLRRRTAQRFVCGLSSAGCALGGTPLSRQRVRRTTVASTVCRRDGRRDDTHSKQGFVTTVSPEPKTRGRCSLRQQYQWRVRHGKIRKVTPVHRKAYPATTNPGECLRQDILVHCTPRGCDLLQTGRAASNFCLSNSYVLPLTATAYRHHCSLVLWTPKTGGARLTAGTDSLRQPKPAGSEQPFCGACAEKVK